MDFHWYFIEISIEIQLDLQWISIGISLKFKLDFQCIFIGISLKFQLDFQWISICMSFKFQLDFQCISIGITLKFLLNFNGYWYITYLNSIYNSVIVYTYMCIYVHYPYLYVGWTIEILQNYINYTNTLSSSWDTDTL